MDLSYLYNQISDAQQRIAELRIELSGLEGFRQQISGDSITFEGQLYNKRATAMKASNLSNIKIAEAYQEKVNSTFGASFQDSVTACFSGVDSQVTQAIHQVEEEIKHQQRKIASLEFQVADEKAREVRRQQLEQEKRRESLRHQSRM